VIPWGELHPFSPRNLRAGRTDGQSPRPAYSPQTDARMPSEGFRHRSYGEGSMYSRRGTFRSLEGLPVGALFEKVGSLRVEEESPRS
jgi:hypothetical protein